MLAFWAAVSAQSAQSQARQARDAAIRLGRALEIGDLIADLNEMQAMLARREFEGTAAKSARLRGRIIRFRAEAYNSLNERQAADIDRAREHLEIITDAATHVGNAKDETRIQRIQSALGQISEALNVVLAEQHGTAQGEE